MFDITLDVRGTFLDYHTLQVFARGKALRLKMLTRITRARTRLFPTTAGLQGCFRWRMQVLSICFVLLRR